LQATGDFTSAVILPVDVEDVGDAYNFIADVPGLEKGDIKVCVPLSVFGVQNVHLHGAISATAVLRQMSQSRLQLRSCAYPRDTPTCF
jgi:hypothetical protein